jgi:hypothetical protein
VVFVNRMKRRAPEAQETPMKKFLALMLGLMFVSTTVMVAGCTGDDDDSAGDDDDSAM